MTLKVLIVDDERAIRRFLNTLLTSHGYTVLEAASGQEGIEIAAREQPALVILDMGLPDVEGMNVLVRIREWTDTPIIILSVRDQDAIKVEALDAGADDYLTKPFSVNELMARMRCALRHAAPQAPRETVFRNHDLTVDLVGRVVTVGDHEIHLTPIEFKLLSTLVSNAGRVMTHNQLLCRVWGDSYEGELHLLRVNMSNLRNKIEPEPARPRYIITESGVGYRLRTST